MLAALAALSASYYCKQTILVVKNTPESFEGPLGDGDRLCINSTLPYLAVAFQQTVLLKVRYYSVDPASTVSRVVSGSHFFIPSETAAIGFAGSIGHVEVQALVPGLVSLSTFAFPIDCARNRYLTTMSDDAFHLANRLGLGRFADTITGAACIWSPHPLTALSGDLTEDARAAFQVCGDDGCHAPWADPTNETRGTLDFKANEYVKIEANRPDLVEDYQVELTVKKNANFLPAYGEFDDDKEDATVSLAARAGDEGHRDVKDVVHPVAPDVEPPSAPTPGVVARVGRARSGLATILSVLQILALTVVIIGAMICIANFAVTRGVFDDAQSGLLGSAVGRGGFPGFAAFLPQAVPAYGSPLYQPPAGFVYPFQQGGAAGFPAAQFPQTPETPVQGDGAPAKPPGTG
jgi:hypothetical protein